MCDSKSAVYTRLSKTVEKYWEEGSYVYALYLVAMVDYLSKRNDIPLYTGYNYFRKQKLKEPFFPLSARILFETAPSKNVVEKSFLDNAIPEFLRYNIVEGDIFNVF